MPSLAYRPQRGAVCHLQVLSWSWRPEHPSLQPSSQSSPVQTLPCPRSLSSGLSCSLALSTFYLWTQIEDVPSMAWSRPPGELQSLAHHTSPASHQQPGSLALPSWQNFRCFTELNRSGEVVWRTLLTPVWRACNVAHASSFRLSLLVALIEVLLVGPHSLQWRR